MKLKVIAWLTAVSVIGSGLAVPVNAAGFSEQETFAEVMTEGEMTESVLTDESAETETTAETETELQTEPETAAATEENQHPETREAAPRNSTKEIESVKAIDLGNDFFAYFDSYNDVGYSYKLLINFTDNTSEEAFYSSSSTKWATASGLRIDSEYMNKGERCGAYDPIIPGENTMLIKSGKKELLSIDFNAKDIENSDFERVEENRETTLRFSSKETLGFWFTPKFTTNYSDVNGVYCNFYTISTSGSRPVNVRDTLTGGQKYLVRLTKYKTDTVKIKLVGESIGQEVNENINVRHDKNYNLTVANSILQLTFIPKKDFTYEIESHGGSNTSVQLIEKGALDPLGSDDDGGKDSNFKLSAKLKAGVTYVYTVRLKNAADTGSFRITLNTMKHNHANTWKITAAATCSKAGKRHQECSLCGEITNEQAIPATGKHSYGKYVTVKEATAVAEGSRTRTCSVCKKKETTAIPRLKGFVKFNFSGTLPLRVKQTTTGVKVTMEKGDSIQSWVSSKPKIVTVSKSGKITAKKAGSAKITVKLKSGASKSFNVKVSKTAVKTKAIKLSVSKLTLQRGKKATIKATVTPFTSKDKVKFKTSNKKIATVSGKGVVTAKKKGKATITVTAGKKTKKCVVTVK